MQENTRCRNTHHTLRSPGLFARWPMLGITMFLLFGLMVGVLAYELQTGESLLQWEGAVDKMFRAAQINAPWTWMENMLFGYFLGREVAIVIGTVLALYFLHQRFWRELALIVIGLGGGVLIGFALSHYFDRPRPTDHLEVLPLSGSSFPGGPALLAVLCYGLLAYLLVPGLSSRLWKAGVVFVCTAIVVMVASSCLLFGTHHASDVITGLALGLAWSGLVFPLVEKSLPPGGESVDDEHRSKAVPSQGLRTPGLFKRRPALGLIFVLLGSLLFAAVAYNVRAQGPLVQLDLTLYKQLLARARTAPPVVQDLMLFGFFVGKQAIQLIVLGLSLYFLWQRYWLELAILQIATQGGGLLKNLVMDQVARPRPPEQMGLVITTLSSFPSGHTLGTLICYGFLAYLLIPKMPSPFWKWMLGIGMLLLVLFEGLSRIFFGNHYLSDVLAGYLLGIALLAFVCTLMETIFVRSTRATPSAS